jgi:hypothetical protein
MSCITKVISDQQFGFIKGRFILDCVVALHEIVHEVKKIKHNGIMLKIDFEEAYDKVNWSFLHKMLDKKGFGDKWGDWVVRTVRGGKVVIKTNNKVGPFFPTHKGVRQGILSPHSFWKSPRGGVNRANLKFTKLITTTSRVSVRNIIKSAREGARQIASE